MQPTITSLDFLLIVWLAILTGLVLFVAYKLTRLSRGANGKNLDAHIAAINEHFVSFTKDKKLIADKLADLDTRLSTTLRGVHTIRFNAFPGAGTGNQSFATALISEKGDGFILSTLTTNERVRLYAKEVRDFKPQTELTEEEATALAEAQKSLHTATR